MAEASVSRGCDVGACGRARPVARRPAGLRAGVAAACLAACLAAPASGGPAFTDRSADIAENDPRRFTMDAASGDVDGDGDTDLVLAVEFRPNLLLLNDGHGRFRPASARRLPSPPRDSEDALLADLDGDGDLDLVVVSEDDERNEFYLNDGTGHFAPEHARLPVAGVSNGVAAADVDGDGDLDIAIANNGPDRLLLNDGAARFRLSDGLPEDSDVTQDVAFADLDGDGDPDIVFANEGPERILINDGAGRFSDETAARLPGQGAGGETRDVTLADIDGDGDLDIVLSNVTLFGSLDPQDRLWINDGTGRFRDETDARLPADAGSTMATHAGDLDGDGDPDLLQARFGDVSGRTWTTPMRALRNDGRGRFVDDTAALLPASAAGNGMHIEPLDADGDGTVELFLASRGGPDRLFGRAPR
jgi:hypothetical protein